MATSKTYEVSVTGLTALLMHTDDIEWAGMVSDWRNNPATKPLVVNGDDRTPAWTWRGTRSASCGCNSTARR